jgi:hypothetical protein
MGLEIAKKAFNAVSVAKKEELQIQKDIESELTPFLDGVYRMDDSSREFQRFKENFIYFHKKYEKKLEIFKLFLKTKEVSLETMGKIYLLFTYLGAVESVGNTLVDILVMLLVANGVDFHIECRYTTPRIKHATSIKELENEWIPLTTKLNFLEENGMKKLKSIIDSRLRNDIAHLNFDIVKDEIYIEGKTAVPIALGALYRLIALFGVTTDLLTKLGKKRNLIS